MPQIERETMIIKGERKELRVDAFLSPLLEIQTQITSALSALARQAYFGIVKK